MSEKPNPVDFFNEEMAQAYDERNSKLSPIKDALLFTSQLVLNDIPEDSKILCVGAGTGSEIITLSKVFPKWSFVALEPSQSMLEVCKTRAKEAGIFDRCEFIHGYVEDAPDQENFEAVLSFFVGHFVEAKQRVSYFKNMIKRLRPNGYLVHADICFDLNSEQYPSMLSKWGEVQKLMGATPESLEKLPDTLEKVLTVVSPEKAEQQIIEGGIKNPVRFFQTLMICGWYGQRE